MPNADASSGSVRWKTHRCGHLRQHGRRDRGNTVEGADDHHIVRRTEGDDAVEQLELAERVEIIERAPHRVEPVDENDDRRVRGSEGSATRRADLAGEPVDHSNQPFAFMQTNDAATPWRCLEHRQHVGAASVDHVEVAATAVGCGNRAEQCKGRRQPAAGTRRPAAGCRPSVPSEAAAHAAHRDHRRTHDPLRDAVAVDGQSLGERRQPRGCRAADSRPALPPRRSTATSNSSSLPPPASGVVHRAVWKVSISSGPSRITARPASPRGIAAGARSPTTSIASAASCSRSARRRLVFARMSSLITPLGRCVARIRCTPRLRPRWAMPTSA